MIQFTLYSRSYCHLCEEMQQQLSAAMQAHPHNIDVIDVDADEALVALYDELVPVLFAKKSDAEPQQICHYFLDVERLKVFLDE